MKGAKLYQNRYHLKEEIGHGGFAKIYLASEKDHSEPVAIKLARATNDQIRIASVREEAKIIQRFSYEGIVRLRPIPRLDKPGEFFYANATDLPGSPVFFVMEYLRGGTLEAYMKLVEKLTVPEAAAIGLQVARALYHMHQRGYAHNDLKLENIVFREPVIAGNPFTPVLIDFGIATRVRLPSAGSLYIMPPEQLASVNLITPPEVSETIDRTKIDVWGLGVVLYRMLGGRLPFAGRNERTMTEQIRGSRPISLTELNREISPDVSNLIIDGCLAKSPQNRLSLLEIGLWLRDIADDNVVAQRSAETVKPGNILNRVFGR